ncbi:hypothetical protein RI543_003033 [Arxiozyma heterogenica]|uniref:Uncharacterized protein n=1 Tax=Arxiozyma heterogenica TaxID=278026 RepID=A0AAN7WLW6_9SACH|nr:hypothetical protein RI543_003033 [Kazachstania heterogenica]
MNTKSLLFLAAIAASANAYTISPAQAKQLDIIFKDVTANLNSYIALVSDPKSGITLDNLPAGLMDIGANLAGNPNYVPNYSEVDINAVSTFITKLPWFLNKIEPQLEAAGVPMVPVTSSSSFSSASSIHASSPLTSVTSTSSSSSSASSTYTSSTLSSVADVSSSSSFSVSTAYTSSTLSPVVDVSSSSSSFSVSPAYTSSTLSSVTSAFSSSVDSSSVLSSSTGIVISSTSTNSSSVISSSVKPTSSIIASTFENTNASTLATSSIISTNSFPANSSILYPITSAADASVETAFVTATNVYSNTTTITSCPPESSATTEVTKEETSTVTSTVCDEICQSRKAAATLTSTAGSLNNGHSSEVTSTQNNKPSTLAQVVSSQPVSTESSATIQQQSENGAATNFVKIGAGVLAAAALLI